MNSKTEIVEDFSIVTRITEADVIELDFASGALDGVFALVRFGRLVEYVKDTFAGDQVFLDRCVDIDQTAQWRQDHQHRGDKGNEAADRCLTVARLVKGNRHDDRECDGDKEMHDRALQCVSQRRAHLQVALVVDDLAETLCFVTLSTEYLDDFLALNGFLQDLGQHALSPL